MEQWEEIVAEEQWEEIVAEEQWEVRVVEGLFVREMEKKWLDDSM